MTRLLEKADVMIENMSPGGNRAARLGYEEVKKINPSHLRQIKGFAPDGPYGKYLSFDMIAQAVGGRSPSPAWRAVRRCGRDPTSGTRGPDCIASSAFSRR